MTSTGSGAWVQPGAFEVAAGVHRIPLPLPNDGLRAVNVYTVATPGGLVLVDAGWALEESRQALVDGLALLGAGLGDIEAFLVTHVHRDHYTQAVTVRRELGTRVSLGVGERANLLAAADPQGPGLQAHVDGLRRLGAGALADRFAATVVPPPDRAQVWELPDVWLEPGDVQVGTRVLEAVATPGHTAGHLVFHDLDAGLLFAGDHVLPTITPSIGFEPVATANPLGAFLRSLAVVRARPDALLLPAHGGVGPSVHARVDELLAFHDRRLDETAAAVAAGASTAYEAADRLHWTRRQLGPASSTCSTPCWRPSRPMPTSCCSRPRAGSPRPRSTASGTIADPPDPLTVRPTNR